MMGILRWKLNAASYGTCKLLWRLLRANSRLLEMSHQTCERCRSAHLQQNMSFSPDPSVHLGIKVIARQVVGSTTQWLAGGAY